MESIESVDTKDRYHGYQEWYDDIDNLWLRGNYKNNREIGYIEWNSKDNIGYEGTIVEFHIR